MSRIRITALLALSTLASFTATAFAQTTMAPSSVSPTSIQGRTAADVPHCQRTGGGSRMRNVNSCDPEQLAAAPAEREPEFLLEPQQPDVLLCEASTLTEYSQRNTVARVEGTISTNCPTGSAGAYTVAARVRDVNGESKVVEFGETWDRDTADDVRFNADYPIGENAELTSVRIRNLTCTCAEAPQDPSTDTATPAQN